MLLLGTRETIWLFRKHGIVVVVVVTKRMARLRTLESVALYMLQLGSKSTSSCYFAQEMHMSVRPPPNDPGYDSHKSKECLHAAQLAKL